MYRAARSAQTASCAGSVSSLSMMCQAGLGAHAPPGGGVASRSKGRICSAPEASFTRPRAARGGTRCRADSGRSETRWRDSRDRRLRVCRSVSPSPAPTLIPPPWSWGCGPRSVAVHAARESCASDVASLSITPAGLGLRVEGVWFSVYSLWFMAYGLSFGSGFGVYGIGFVV